MLISNRLNVTVICSQKLSTDEITEIKNKTKEHFNTDNVLILSGFGEKDELIIIDTATNQRLC